MEKAEFLTLKDDELEALADELRQEIMTLGYEDPVFFCRMMFPHLFKHEMPWFHRGILAILTRKTDFLLEYGELDKIISNFVFSDDPDNPNAELHAIFTPELDEAGNIVALHMRVTKNTMIMVPRGFSKTTLAGIAGVIYFIVYVEFKFAVYVSETATHAEMQLGNAARELETNRRILAIYGSVVPPRQSSLKWTQELIQTTTGVSVAARGRGGQIRGMNISGQRPDIIIVDDVEDKESVKNPEQIKKTREWAYADMMPAQGEMDEHAAIVALGTLLHKDALLMTWMRDPDWTSIRFGAVDRQGDALWAMNMNLEKLEKKKQTYALIGELGIFYMEYMSILRSEETAKFKQAYLRYNQSKIEDFVARAIAIDPAISKKKRADFCGIGVVGMKETGRISVLDVTLKKGMTPREQVNEYFRLNHKWRCTHHGVESIAYQASLIYLLQEEMFRMDKLYPGTGYFEVTPITHSARKEDRVEGILQPRYAAGYIEHQMIFPQYETQLLEWPDGKMDGPDVVAMAISLLAPFAAQAGMDPETGGKDLADDEYEPLDKLFEGEWRQHV